MQRGHETIRTLVDTLEIVFDQILLTLLKCDNEDDDYIGKVVNVRTLLQATIFMYIYIFVLNEQIVCS